MSTLVAASDRTKVLVIEDEPELLRHFVDAIILEPEFALAGAVTNGIDAMAAMATLIPDLVLLDLGLPDIDGVELIRRVTRHATKHSRKVDIVVVTMFGDDDHVLSSIYAGACGYLLKDGCTQAIVAGIREARAGGSPITPTIARRVLAHLRSTTSQPPEMPSGTAIAAAISPREVEILRLISKGLSVDEVAQSLQISAHTVGTHIKKIYRKLAVHSRSEAVYEARQLGLL